VTADFAKERIEDGDSARRYYGNYMIYYVTFISIIRHDK